MEDDGQRSNPSFSVILERLGSSQEARVLRSRMTEEEKENRALTPLLTPPCTLLPDP